MSDLAKRATRAAFEVLHGAYRLSRAPKITNNFAMTLDRDDLDEARSWLGDRTKWGDTGVVQKYEREFAEWNGSQFAYAFQAGRKALSACIYALELLPGDEVIVPGFTCVMVTNSFEFAKIKPVYCDIELDTYGPNLESIERKITPRTRAIVVQHLFGLVCRDYEKVLELAAQRNIHVIEDCAQSTGASFNGKKVGTRGAVGFFSSERSKIFTTVVGGIAVTDRPDIARRLQTCSQTWSEPSEAGIEKQLRNVAMDYYQYKHPLSQLLSPFVNLRHGNSYITNMMSAEIQGEIPSDYYTRMPAPIAALALNQLRKIDAYNAVRRETAKKWDSWALSRGYKVPMVLPGSIPVFLRYPLLVEPDRKADTKWARDELGIDIGVWFRTNIHPAAKIVEDCPNADLAVERCVNMPTILDPRSKFGRS